MFLLVSVWVRQWQALKHHPYNFGTQNLFLLLSVWQTGYIWSHKLLLSLMNWQWIAHTHHHFTPTAHTTPTKSFLPSVSFLTATKINKWHTITDSTTIHIFESLHMLFFSLKKSPKVWKLYLPHQVPMTI